MTLKITGTFCEYSTADGCVLKYRHYRPFEEPRAYVIAVHGIQSHSGWYDWSSSQLAKAGYDVRFLDRRGSGLNKESRSHIVHWRQWYDDELCEMAKLVTRERSGGHQPIILTSVSWGGKLVAGGFALHTVDGKERTGSVRRQSLFDGIALLYPAIFTHFEPRLLQRAAIQVANQLGQGRRQVAIPLSDPQLFTDVRQWQAFIRDDPLALRQVSLSFLRETLTLTRAARRLSDFAPPPVFLALAGRDEIVDVPRTREWAARLPEETTRIVEYSDARHTLEFDADREQFVADLIEWIESLIDTNR